jgi:hypothetical protein
MSGFSSTPMARSFGAAPQFAKPVQFLHPPTGRKYRVFGNVIEEFVPDVYSDPRRMVFSIGSGNHAKSFLTEREGRLYQAPVTFYTQAGNWDMSPGYGGQQHAGFTRLVTPDCLYCHTNAASPPAAIGCERCHGPVERHLREPGKAILNPAKLPPRLRDEVCEQCHLLGAARVVHRGKKLSDYEAGQPLNQVLAAFGYDAGTQPRVTGHPEQLKRSRCWQQSGDRLWCGSCHEVHRPTPPAQRAALYRARCLSCHKAENCTRPPDAKTDCAECHMPKTAVAESAHVALTNHEIRRRPEAAAASGTVAALKPLLPLLDDRVAANRALGFAYLDVAGSTGRPEFVNAALEVLQPLSEALATDAEFWENMAEALLRLGENAKAEAAFQRTLALRPTSPAALYGLGFLRQASGRLPEAVELYRRAVRADPAMADAWRNLAAALVSLNQSAAAKEALDAALRLEPGNLALRRARSQLK